MAASEKVKRPPAAADGEMKSLRRAINVVRQIAAAEPDGARFTDLVTAAGLPKATLHRILATLQRQSWVAFDSVDQVYLLGNEFLALSNVAAERHRILDLARMALPRISERLDETVYLSMRSGFDRVCIDRHETSRPIRTLAMDVGTRMPLGIGAGGLALIAHLPDHEIENILAHNAQRFSDFPRINDTVCRDIIDAARDNGFAVHHGIMLENLSGIAFPLLDRRDVPIAAISIAMLTANATETRQREVIDILANEVDLIISSLRQRHDNGFHPGRSRKKPMRSQADETV